MGGHAEMNKKSYEDVSSYVSKIAERKGWVLNDNSQTLQDLVEGLMQNFNRHGYYNCPCRDSQNDHHLDRDIICPCKYSDPDIQDFGHCYCALYFDPSTDLGGHIGMIPERRPE